MLAYLKFYGLSSTLHLAYLLQFIFQMTLDFVHDACDVAHSMKNTLSDIATRERIVDPATSAIVMAPAGSGKTSLLSERYLRLLTRASTPETILVITFTNKAAEEIKTRIQSALITPESKAAKAARTRGEEEDWGTVSTWHLNIMTIDGLWRKLLSSVPLLEGVSMGTAVTRGRLNL